MPPRNARTRKPTPVAPARTRAAYLQLSDRDRDIHERAIEGLHLVRHEGLSVTAAAKRTGMTPATFAKRTGAIYADARGRLRARRSDRLYTQMRFLAPDGPFLIGVSSSRQRSQVGAYWSAVERFRETGKTDRLRPLRGVTIRADGRSYRFVTEPKTLKRIARAGRLGFLELYSTAA